MKTLRIDGVIGVFPNTAEDIREQIDFLNLDQGEDLEVTVNSGGGSVFEGFSIYNHFRSMSNRVIMHGEGLVGSISTLILLSAAPEDTHISEVSRFMIHRALVGTGGNAEDLEREAEMLRSIDETLIKVYSERTGLSSEKIEQMMSEETWLKGDEAVEMGFVGNLSNPISAQAVADANSIYINQRNMSLINSIKNIMNVGEAPTVDAPVVDETVEAAVEETVEETVEPATEDNEEVVNVTQDEFNEFKDEVTGTLTAIAESVGQLVNRTNTEEVSIENRVEAQFKKMTQGLPSSSNEPIVNGSPVHGFTDKWSKHREEQKAIDEKNRRY